MNRPWPFFLIAIIALAFITRLGHHTMRDINQADNW